MLRPKIRWRAKRLCFICIVILVSVIIIWQWLYISNMRTNFIQNLMSEAEHGEAIIAGWEYKPMLSQLEVFIKPSLNTTKLVGANLCSQSSVPLVLFIICSPVENFSSRVAIRKTWANDSRRKYNITVAFLVGLSGNDEVNTRIQNENHLYEDLILEDFVDSRYNDTIKSIFMMKWMVNNCSGAKFLMKSVDDAFINLGNLAKFVNDPSRYRELLLVGKLITNQDVIRDSLKDRYMPTYMYPYETYPDYLSGVGYLMTIKAAQLLYEKVLFTSYIYLEDVYITGLLAQSANIVPFYDFRFYFIEHGENRMDCSIVYQQSLIIHSHSVDIATMYRDFNELNRCLDQKLIPS